jgi:hypothetical protein
MKLTEISQYDAQPGELIEWTLDAATIAAAAASAQDPRPPSYTQDAHVRMAAHYRDLGVQAPTWLATAFDVKGALDAEAMEATLQQWIARHETLRSGLRLEGQELERFTLTADAMSLDRIVVDQFTCGAEVVRYLEDRFDEAANPLKWPPYIFVTVGREDGFTVYLAFDHSNVDGYSIAQTAHEIHELYGAAVAGRPAQLPEAGSYVDFSRLEREAVDGIDAGHDAVVSWRDFVATCGGTLPKFPLDLGVAPGDVPRQTGDCESVLDVAGADAFDAACKALGGNFSAGVLAAASIVSYELSGDPVYRSVVPLHTRSASQWAPSLGWYIGLAPIEIATAEAEDFGALVRMARQASRATKPLAQVPFAKVCTLLDAPVRPLSVISYIDARVVPGASQWSEWNAHAFGKVSYGDEVYMWINRNDEGAFLTVRYPTTEMACANVTAFVERMREVLTSVAQTGTYSIAGSRVRELLAA